MVKESSSRRKSQTKRGRPRKKPTTSTTKSVGNKNKNSNATNTNISTKKRKTIHQHRRERKRLEKKQKKQNKNESNSTNDNDGSGTAMESKPKVVAASPTTENIFWEVEKVVGRRVNKGRVEYLIRWKGCTESDNTWEPTSNLCDTAMTDAIRYAKEEKLKEQRRLQDERKLGLLPPHETDSEETTEDNNKDNTIKEMDIETTKSVSSDDDNDDDDPSKAAAITQEKIQEEIDGGDTMWKWADQDQIIYQPVERIHVHGKNVQQRVTEARINGTPIVLVGHIGWANFAKDWLIPKPGMNSNSNDNDDIHKEDENGIMMSGHHDSNTIPPTNEIQPSSTTATSSLSSSASWNESSNNDNHVVTNNEKHQSPFFGSSSSSSSAPTNHNGSSKIMNGRGKKKGNHQRSKMNGHVESISSSSWDPSSSSNKDNHNHENSNNDSQSPSLPSASAAAAYNSSNSSSSWNDESSNNTNNNGGTSQSSSWNPPPSSNPTRSHGNNVPDDVQPSSLPSTSESSSSWNASTSSSCVNRGQKHINDTTKNNSATKAMLLDTAKKPTPKVISPALSSSEPLSAAAAATASNKSSSTELLDLSQPHELDISRMLEDIGSEDVPVVRRNYNEMNPIHGVIPASRFLDKCWPSSKDNKKNSHEISAASRLYLHQWQFPLSDTAGRKLCHRNNPLPNDILGEDLLKYWIDLPQCKLDSPLQYLFMGREETLSKLHRDTGGLAISIAPIVGEKECVMVHRSDGTSCLYHLDADLEHADLHSFPLMARARVWKTTILPGEILLMPQGTYHQCRNLKPCLSYSRFHLDTVNLHAFLQSMLDRDAPEIVHDEVLWNCTSELARQLDAFVDRVREHRKQQQKTHTNNEGSVLVDENIIRIVDTLRSLRHIVREVARRISTKNAIKGKGSHTELVKSLQAEHDWNILVDDVDVSLHEFRYRHHDKVPHFKPRRCKLFLGNKLLHRPGTMTSTKGGCSTSTTTNKSAGNTNDSNPMQAVAYDTDLEKSFLELPSVPDSSATSVLIDPSLVTVGDTVCVRLCGKKVSGSILRIESQMSVAFLSYDEYPALYDDFQPYESLRSPVTGAEVRPEDIKAGLAVIHRDGGDEYRGIVQHTTCETMFSIRLEIGKFRINRWLTIGSILNPKKIPRRTESPVKKCFDVEAVVPVESA